MAKIGETGSNFLQSLIGKGIDIRYINGCSDRAILMAFDEFTLICRIEISTNNSGCKIKKISLEPDPTLIYKHSLSKLTEVPYEG